MTNNPVKKLSKEFSADSNSPYIVGLGASAGGLEALQQFFSAMSDNSGMAFVVVQHLSPDYKSMMVELLSKTTSMSVLKVENGMEINPNHVYIIPPKTQMTIYKGKLFLEESDYSKGLLLPIDTFLKSLADDQGEKSIGIILSGTGSDGTRGITTIKGAPGAWPWFSRKIQLSSAACPAVPLRPGWLITSSLRIKCRKYS